MKNSLLLTVLIVFAYSQATFDLIENSNGRINKLLMNTRRSFRARGDINVKESIFVSPTPQSSSTRDFVDICDVKNYNFLISPILSNTTFNGTFCEFYFCSNSTPHYLSERNLNFQAHIDLHRFCLQCSATLDQKFDQFLKNSTCPHFDRTICTNTSCSNSSTCVIFDDMGKLCYKRDEKIFYRFEDYTHKTLYWAYLRYFTYVGVPFYIFLFFLYTFLVVVPEYRILFKTYDRTSSFFTKCINFIGLRTQAILWIYLAIIIFKIAIIFDSLELTASKSTSLAVIISFVFIYFAFFNVIAKWSQILQRAEDGSDKVPYITIIVLISAYTVFFAFCGVGIGLSAINTFVLGQNRGALYYAQGVYYTFFLFTNLVLVVLISIYSIRILITLSQNKEEFSKNLVKMSFSKTVLWMNLSSLPLNCMFFISLLLFFFGKDLFSMQFWLILPHITNVLLFISFIGFTFAFTKKGSLKITYCCCLIKTKE